MDAGLTPLFLFPTYANREAAIKEGIPESVMPPFDPSKPRKSWFDPNPPAVDDEGDCVYSGVAHTLLGSVKTGADGKPYYAKIRMKPQEARAMNLQPNGPPEFTNIGEVPMPCRPLEADEEFVRNWFAGWKVAKKAAAPSTGSVITGAGADYTARFDRIDAQLKAITEELLSK